MNGRSTRTPWQQREHVIGCKRAWRRRGEMHPRAGRGNRKLSISVRQTAVIGFECAFVGGIRGGKIRWYHVLPRPDAGGEVFSL